MLKTSFITTSMVATISEAAGFRESITTAMQNLLSDSMLSQVATNVENSIKIDTTSQTDDMGWAEVLS